MTELAGQSRARSPGGDALLGGALALAAQLLAAGWLVDVVVGDGGADG